jgi:hypothetical protein
MWSTSGSPNAGSYTISWNTNTAGCTWEDIYPPNGWYMQICNWLEEKAGSGVWTTASTSGNSISFSGKAPNTYQYRLLMSFDGGAPTQVEWLPEVVVSSAPVAATTFRKCVPSGGSSCDSAYKLELDMINSGLLSALPYGALIVSTSESVPISSILTVCSAGPSGAKSACALVRGDQEMVDLDNKVYARAAQIDPVLIPPGVAPSAVSGGPEWEFVQQAAGENFTFVRYDTSILHAILTFSLQVAYVDFIDNRDGSAHRIWVNDTITVKFSDGSTAQLKLISTFPVAGAFFHLVPGSERDANGDPVAAPPPQAANQVGNGGGDLSMVFSSGDSIAINLVFTMCVQTILYSESTGYSGYFRKFYPCMQLQ